MRAGDLRHQVDIEQLAGSTADGMGNTFQAWEALYAGVPAEVKPLTSQERWTADKAQAITTHRVRMRWLDGITTAMRVKFGSRVLTINGIVNTDERNIELVLDCKEAS
jgi:SPP1 family predicted phage head-tail adaptor